MIKCPNYSKIEYLFCRRKLTFINFQRASTYINLNKQNQLLSSDLRCATDMRILNF